MATKEDFQIAKSFVHTVKVVNDAAEGSVKLNTENAAILTVNPVQRASLLQSVVQHRKNYPDFRKITLNKSFKEWVIYFIEFIRIYNYLLTFCTDLGISFSLNMSTNL